MQNAGIHDFAVLFGTNGKVAVSVDPVPIRMIENLPFSQLAVAGEPYTSRADAAQRKGHIG